MVESTQKSIHVQTPFAIQQMHQGILLKAQTYAEDSSQLFTNTLLPLSLSPTHRQHADDLSLQKSQPTTSVSHIQIQNKQKWAHCYLSQFLFKDLFITKLKFAAGAIRFILNTRICKNCSIAT